MSLFRVERQCWQHWPKVLVVAKDGGRGDERRRYVPERTCRNESGLDWAFACSECGHAYRVDVRFCPNCGRKVVEE